jgi:DNA-binding transcriptional MerR regulator
MAARTVALKVGTLAKRTGISVRTLHYYDEIGVLSPSHRTESGHRLYAAGDVARLQQIRSLQELGLSLEEVRTCLANPGFSPRRVVTLHHQRVREQIGLLQELSGRLERLGAWLDECGEATIDEFIDVMEGMKMVEKYYTPEQLEQLKQRRETVGEERIRQVEAEWPELIAAVQVEMERGTDPADPRVQALATRWMALVEEFTGGDPAIAKAARSMWENETTIHGMDTAPMRGLMEYVNRVLAARSAQ